MAGVLASGRRGTGFAGPLGAPPTLRQDGGGGEAASGVGHFHSAHLDSALVVQAASPLIVSATL